MDYTPEQKKLETFVTVMSKLQYRRLELISQGKLEPSDFTEKEIRSLEKKLQRRKPDKVV